MSNGTHILVTGATSGLGREMALKLAARGERVIASGRREARLAELEAQDRITGLKLDLSHPEDITAAIAKLPPLSGVILNAGITFAEPFTSGDLQTDMSMTPVPYQSVYAGTKAFMVNFGLSLREELKHDNVQVSVFAPGGIKTEMTDIPALKGLDSQMAPVADVAAAAIKAYDKMPAITVPGAQNKLVAGIAKILPRGFLAAQTEKIYLKSQKD